MITAMNHCYDKSGNNAVGVTSNARLEGQGIAGIQKYASQASIHGNDQVSLSSPPLYGTILSVNYDPSRLFLHFSLDAKRHTRSTDRLEVPLAHWRLRSGVQLSPALHLRLRTSASR
jgi:hypothetical protein